MNSLSKAAAVIFSIVSIATLSPGAFCTDDAPPPDQALTPAAADVPLLLDTTKVMKLTVRLLPDIRGALERRAAEEARYDFFITNRSGLSCGLEVESEYDRQHVASDRGRTRSLDPELFIQKDFYNTASVRVGTGYSLSDSQHSHEAAAFVKGTVSLPLFGSREALARSNDKIFQQTKVNDARLEYFRVIRWRISWALESLSDAQRFLDEIRSEKEYIDDLKGLLEISEAVKDRDTSSDREKLRATMTSAAAHANTTKHRYTVQVERLKVVIGLPLETQVVLVEADFNPFEGKDLGKLQDVALQTDEEIKTLRNSLMTSQAELDLARKGKWDTSLFVSGRRAFAGNGQREDEAGYTLSGGVTLRRIDARISRSLENIALAKMREYRSAITGRERKIRFNTTEAYLLMESAAEDVSARKANISRYFDDYRTGIEQYRSGAITIDELVRKRKLALEEQNDVARGAQRFRMNVFRLVTSTGLYTQFIDPENTATRKTP